MPKTRGGASAPALWRAFAEAIMSCRPPSRDDSLRHVHVARVVNEGTPNQAKPIANPAYAEWEERRDFLKGLLGTPLGTGDGPATTAANPAVTDALVRFASEASPPRFLESPEPAAKRTVLIEHVSTIAKGLSTLYLREDDMRHLRSSLNLFKDKKDVIRDLGLPHKLGVLLHGEPGTGKSTTIAAIASYLRKDVYYLHLGSVQTNDDLRMLFEHVTKNCVDGGGIVVMEDIDAMAPVVLRRRHGEKSESISSPRSSNGSNSHGESVETDSDCGSSSLPHHQHQQHHHQTQKTQTITDAGCKSVTLDYFLNLLQGTLTLDGMVFVTTTNHLAALDPAFYRPGRFDVVLELRACDRFQVQQAFRRFLGRDPSPGVLARVAENLHTPAAVTSRLAAYVCCPTSEADDEDILEPFLSGETDPRDSGGDA